MTDVPQGPDYQDATKQYQSKKSTGAWHQYGTHVQLYNRIELFHGTTSLNKLQ